MDSENEKETIELVVSLKTWIQLVLALVTSGFLFFLILSFIMPLLWGSGGGGID
jgi:hypothetical protein